MNKALRLVSSKATTIALQHLTLTHKRECIRTWVVPFRELKGEGGQINTRNFKLTLRGYLNHYLLFVFVFFLFANCTNRESQKWEVVENENGVEIKENGKKVLFYQVAEESKDGEYKRANYIHPLYGMNEEVLTEDFPEDHYHHRGIFWIWHQTWIGEKRIGDAWECKDFVWDVKNVTTKENSDNTMTIKSDVFWKSPLWLDENKHQKPFAQENVSITIHPESDGVRSIDFEIIINALEDSLFIGGSEDAKGYGGYSVRVFMPEDIQFVSKSGVVEPQTLAVEAGNWMDITGSYMNDNPQSGVFVLNHKDNPGMPQKWILRKKGSMQNPVFPGNGKYEIKKDTPVMLKYRLVLHEENLGAEKIEKIYQSYLGDE